MESGKTVQMHHILAKAFLIKKKKNPAYSQRALARDLGTSPVFVTKLLAGQKKVPAARYKKLFKILDMDLSMQTEFMKAAMLIALPTKELRSIAKASLGSARSTMDSLRVEPKKFGILRHWYNAAILIYVSCEDLDSSVPSISNYFKLTEAQVTGALTELEAAGLAKMENGIWIKNKNSTHFSNTKSRAELTEFNRQMIQKAFQETTKTSQEDSDKRLLTTLTVAVNPDKIELAKKLFSSFLGEISEILNEGVCKEVYQCNIQLFPLGRAPRDAK